MGLAANTTTDLITVDLTIKIGGKDVNEVDVAW